MGRRNKEAEPNVAAVRCGSAYECTRAAFRSRSGRAGRSWRRSPGSSVPAGTERTQRCPPAPRGGQAATLVKGKSKTKKKKKQPTSGQNVRANCNERSPRKRASATLALKVAKGAVASQEVTRWRQEAVEKRGEDSRNYCQLQLFM